MRWLSNIYDPSAYNAVEFIDLRYGESRADAWRDHLDWLQDKIIDRPKATGAYTVEQLEVMNMVGVYERD